nr:hypothetical protein [Desulfobacula sp.]
MNSQSIEFNRIKENLPLPETVRKSFRVPVEDRKNIRLMINDIPYPVQDIGLEGIGIAAGDSLAFVVDQALSNCELHYFDRSVKPLNGRIVHISVTPGLDWKYGIQWEGTGKEASEGILSIVREMKDQLLGKGLDPEGDI